MMFRRSVIAMGVLVLGLTLCAKAQHSHVSSSAKWFPQKIAVPTALGKLRVRLSDPEPRLDWIIGVRVDDKNQGMLNVAEVLYDTSELPSMPMRHISQIVNWSADKIKIAPGSVEITGLPKVVGSLLVYATVPLGTELSIESSHKILVSASVADGLLVYNGILLSEPIENRSILLNVLSLPRRLKKNTVEVLKDAKGQHSATIKGLASHLIVFRKPEFPTGTTAVSDDGSTVLLRVRIDEGGNVSDVYRIRGEALFLSACEAAIREWKFRPFVVDEKSVSVTASIPFFFFGANRTVSSPIFQELGK